MLKDIAAACGVAENRPSKWRSDERFRDAMTAAITAEHKHLAAAARTAMYQLAIAGNLAAFDRIRGVERDLEQLNNPSNIDGGAGVPPHSGVAIHIHGIPERQPMSALPPALTLPASSSAATTTTPAK